MIQGTQPEQPPFSETEWAQTPPAVQEFVLVLVAHVQVLGFDDHLGLVSLAMCESARSDSPWGFLGIAPKIVQRGVPAVVAMQYNVLIKTAEIFLENFYASIAARKPVDWAVQWAHNAVSIEMGLGNREFATAVLYMRAEDGEIFMYCLVGGIGATRLQKVASAFQALPADVPARSGRY
jgi:hypothetical protein